MLKKFIDSSDNYHYDDLEIKSHHGLFRRVHEANWDWAEGCPNSSAIDVRQDMSLCFEEAKSLEEYQSMYPTHGIIRFTANQLRNEEEVVLKEPSEDECSDCHVNSWKSKRNKAYRRKLARKLAEIKSEPTRQDS